jgi:ESS family glutamate:Na+ symporter
MLVPTLKLSTVHVLGLAALGVVLGEWLKKRLPVLDRLNIPGSVAGGLVYAVVALLLRDRYVNFEVDATVRDLLQIAFFTTIGLNASWSVIRRGGSQVIWFWVLASGGALLQGVLGAGLARLFGVNPLVGVICGAGALAGGPATSLAFGPVFEKLGAAGATTAGLASATFGITGAGLLSGYLGGRLIRGAGSRGAGSQPAAPSQGAPHLMRHVLVLATAMGLGSLIGSAVERAGVVLPAYIGAMIVAAVLRNLDERCGCARISPGAVSEIGAVALHLFIVAALLSLRLWELVHLAVPMLVMLALQVALVWLLSVTVVHRAMGRDYEAAVMAAGYCGFMLGITANAVAAMEELERKHGPAPQAFIVVPLVGAFLIDFTDALLLTLAANLLPRLAW